MECERAIMRRISNNANTLPIKLFDTTLKKIKSFLSIFSDRFQDIIKFLCQLCQSKAGLAAENMFLRKQLAMYEERKVKPKRATNAIRIAMAWLSRLFDWKNALIVVKPATLISWHRNLFKLFWKFKSQGGRLVIPEELQLIIKQRSAP